MENKFSSTAVVKINHQAVKDAQYDLPSSYGKTESFLLPKDPAWMFLFWDIVKDTFEYVKSEYGQDIFEKAKSVIRVYDVTGVEGFNGSNALSFFDVSVVLDAGSWYIGARGGCMYICDIGLVNTDGSFILLSRSNATSLPTGKVSNIVDEKWMMVEGDYQKLLKMSGADIFGAGAGSLGASEKLQHVLSQRWKMYEYDINNIPSSHISSRMSSGVFMTPEEQTTTQADEDIWLKADCELIVYGQASKNAEVFLDGKPLLLNADGSFSLRYSLQDGKVVIPITARHHSKEEKKRAITIRAQREKEI